MTTDTLEFLPDIDEARGERSTSVRIPTVLVVDDDSEFRDLLTEFLWDAGYRVRTASNGIAAFHGVDPRISDHGVATDIDLVITDLYMPRMSGLEFIAHLRAWSLTTPVIAVSAFPSADFYRRSAEMSCVRAFAKPFSFFDLLDFIDDLFDR